VKRKPKIKQALTLLFHVVGLPSLFISAYFTYYVAVNHFFPWKSEIIAIMGFLVGLYAIIYATYLHIYFWDRFHKENN